MGRAADLVTRLSRGSRQRVMPALWIHAAQTETTWLGLLRRRTGEAGLAPVDDALDAAAAVVREPDSQRQSRQHSQSRKKSKADVLSPSGIEGDA